MTLALDREIYRKNPIVEAVIDIRCLPEVSPRDLAPLGESLMRTEKPPDEIVDVMTTHRSDGATEETRKLIGYAFRSKDERLVLQLLTNGFSISHLVPYDRWESFRDSAKAIWANYVKIGGVQTITKLGVRFV